MVEIRGARRCAAPVEAEVVIGPVG
jgi:hypothetical protein